MPHARELKAGEEYWYIPSHGLLIVKVKITEVEDWARKQHPAGYLFYEIDEPVGHSVDESQLYSTKKEAVKELIRRLQENTQPSLSELCGGKQREHNPELFAADLMDIRRRTMTFILSTWKDAPEEEKDIEKRLKNYPEKVHGQDWFNLTDLGIK